MEYDQTARVLRFTAIEQQLLDCGAEMSDELCLELYFEACERQNRCITRINQLMMEPFLSQRQLTREEIFRSMRLRAIVRELSVVGAVLEPELFPIQSA